MEGFKEKNDRVKQIWGGGGKSGFVCQNKVLSDKEDKSQTLLHFLKNLFKLLLTWQYTPQVNIMFLCQK